MQITFRNSQTLQYVLYNWFCVLLLLATLHNIKKIQKNISLGGMLVYIVDFVLEIEINMYYLIVYTLHLFFMNTVKFYKLISMLNTVLGFKQMQKKYKQYAFKESKIWHLAMSLSLLTYLLTSAIYNGSLHLSQVSQCQCLKNPSCSLVISCLDYCNVSHWSVWSNLTRFKIFQLLSLLCHCFVQTLHLEIYFTYISLL